ncbi:hypothetical protein A0256_07870 [Mucilaginibacter sp. PAMC 26640]|nr:hypothetical protein A0256_07870 [Mucilaginibacter sp. PAMC 26640]
MFKQLVVTVFFVGLAFFCKAQNPDSLAKTKDTAVVKRDTVARTSFAPKIKKDKKYHPDSTHIPSLAVKRSLLIPGWGQVYNHKYWKVPLIYAGLGLLGSAIVTNQREFQRFLALAKISKSGSVPVPGSVLYASYIKYQADYNRFGNLGYQTLADASDGYLRNRDISILSTLVVWGVQAIDAYIDAKFISSYTVDNDLSMKVTPGFIQPLYAANYSNAYIPGIKITFTLN